MEAKSASHGSETVLHASAKEAHGEVHVLMRWISQVLSGGMWPACRAAWPRLWRRRRTSRA